ncbi:SdrD B-like domain-containing protein [Planctomicrobium piriforme]|uniref:Peptidase M10 serralysin C terminal n=1 Tax=Planctomicrobium piriforme TaxID=1576369 RepID=A0A1I3P6Z5_9PLAN|nr:SdrD B-like domain-containing protein [Planctomicrobium piriforme]SFJ17171.1 Peptidase M10 serralysin C terminal [Planctomicrobium piriforme]
MRWFWNRFRVRRTAVRSHKLRGTRSFVRRRDLIEQLEVRALLSSVSGRLFVDADHDGIQGGTEGGLYNQTIYLNGPQFLIGHTDAQGYYSFQGLAAGNYSIQFFSPSNYIFTAQGVGPEATDSDVGGGAYYLSGYGSYGGAAAFTLTAGENLQLDAGIYVGSVVEAFVWNDANRNGLQDGLPDEAGIQYASVRLYYSPDGIQGNGDDREIGTSTSTDANGLARFDGLNPGNYYLDFTVPAGLALTVPDAGDDLLDSDFDPTTDKSGMFTLGPGESQYDVDAGLVTGNTVGDRVWNDQDRDGIQDAEEVGVIGARIQVYRTTDATIGNGDDQFVEERVSLYNGYYQTSNLAPGNYYLKFFTPSGYVNTIPNAGGDAQDSDQDPDTGLTGIFSVINGQPDTTRDFGVYQKEDIILHEVTALGSSLQVTYEIAAYPVAAFDIGFYVSTDRRFDGFGVDSFLDYVSISAPADLSVGVHVKTFALGSSLQGDNIVSLPGAGLTDVNGDYYILGVADDTVAIDEADNDPFNDDNTTSLVGLYHLVGGAVYVHGAEGIDAVSTSGSSPLTISFNGVDYSYPAADITQLQVRSHSGDDVVSLVSGNKVAIVFGGDGGDQISGGAQSDTLDGGSGNDSINGRGGADALIGGIGDDAYLFDTDSGLGSDTITDVGGVDTLDFSGTTTKSVTVDLAISGSQVINSNLSLTLGATTPVENVIGGALSDMLLGNSASNRIAGLGGDDLLQGRGSDDTYAFDTDSPLGSDTITEIAGQGSDWLDFSATSTKGISINLALISMQVVNANLSLSVGNDMENVIGGELADIITGNGLNNWLMGKAGDDWYLFDTDLSLGSDIIQDDSGVDTLDFRQTLSRNVSINLSQVGNQVVNSGLTLNLTSEVGIENVYGGQRNDTIQGNSQGNYLAGEAGNDRYLFDADGELGSDVVDEGTDKGIDTFDFSKTTLRAVTVDLGTTALQKVDAYLKLSLTSGSVIENLIGGSKNDTLRGNVLNNEITGRGGNDLMVGRTGNDSYLFDTDQALGSDTIDESAGGVDTLNFSTTTTRNVWVDLSLPGLQVVNAGLSLTLSSRATLENIIGGQLHDTLIGNAKDNVITGLDGDDLMVGAAGNDTYVFDADLHLGNDTIDETGGGSGDTLDFTSTSTLGIVLDLSLTSLQTLNVNHTLTLTTNDGVENVLGTGQADQIGGNSRANQFTGGDGDDMLSGGAGNDRYLFDADGPQGQDTLNDASGIDTLDFSATTSIGITIDLRMITLQTINQYLKLNLSGAKTFENVVGTSQADHIFANAGSNVLDGGAGSDTYSFVANSASGVDQILDSSGAEDTLDFSLTTVGLTLNLSLTANQVVNAFLTLQLSNGDAIENVIGGQGNDNLTGNSAGNEITGLAGDDTLAGSGGDDTYFFDCDTSLGTDTLVENAGGGTDLLDFSQTSSLAIQLDLQQTAMQTVNSNLKLVLSSGSGFENVDGGSRGDVLLGNSLANVLNGLDGNDILSGRGGADSLIGGSAKNLLCGGADGDILTGASSGDLLVGGTTQFDADTTALKALLSEWARTDLTYEQRIAHLQSASGGNNGSTVLNLATVFNDGIQDILTGNGDRDWFFSSINDLVLDLNNGGAETVVNP